MNQCSTCMIYDEEFDLAQSPDFGGEVIHCCMVFPLNIPTEIWNDKVKCPKKLSTDVKR